MRLIWGWFIVIRCLLKFWILKKKKKIVRISLEEGKVKKILGNKCYI